MAATLLWYDLETFGLHPQWDRIGQFAAIRTDGNFEQIGEAEELYCQMSPDYLPHPDACLLTKLTPQTVNEKGISEREFTQQIHSLMSVSNTCVAGYNNLRFDDEFVRSLFYRNFYDPYKREYEHSNSRWDIIDLARMAHDLRPDGVVWPHDEDGRPVFKLEALAQANGLTHEHAHDALSDVKATIALAKLLHEKQKKLFQFYFGLRKREEVRRLLNLQEQKVVVFTSGLFTSPNGCSTLVLPLSVHPAQSNVIIAYDLRHDPSDWVDQSVEEIRQRVFSRKEDIDPDTRISLVQIHINRCPAVSPLATLNRDQARTLHVDMDRALEYARQLRSRTDLIQKIRSVYLDKPRSDFKDPELRIYTGDFFPDEDREVFNFIRTSPPEVLLKAQPALHDPRGPELLRRYIARNYPEQLSETERERWRSFCASRLLTPEPNGAVDFGTFVRDVDNRLSRIDTPATDKKVLKSLKDWGSYLEETVLS